MKKNGIEEIIKSRKFPGIVGSRDSFGIGNEFVHEGKVIDNWKKWEKAGFKDVESTHDKRSPNLKHLIKEKIKEKRWRKENPLKKK